MAYSDFNLTRVQKDFDLRIVDEIDLFGHVPDMPLGAHLAETLGESIAVAKAINTEKARSELIVSPLLLELRRRLGHRISFFSGVELAVDPDRGLNGYCDFLVAKSPNQWILSMPVLVVIEAKNDNVKGGLGQCAATMLAARLFNANEGSAVPAVYGAVTTGTLWQFLRLEGMALGLDSREYHISQAEKVFGILHWIMSDEGGAGRLVA